MPDDLYHRDVLAWSLHQADLLRRLGRGERVNDIDWEIVAEEIEDVGLSELRAAESYLKRMLVHLLKIYGWPDSASADHWRAEIDAFQTSMRRQFAPSMRQRIAIAGLYSDALRKLRRVKDDGRLPTPFPTICPFTLDQLLTAEPEALEEVLSAPTLG